MSIQFATKALLGGICAASAPWADLGRAEDHYGSYTAHTLEPSREGQHLAVLLGTQTQNGLSSEQSNSLDEMASAMLERNAEYAEDLIDHHSAELPTFHVVHEQEEHENTLAPSKQSNRPHKPASKNEAELSSSTSSESSARESSVTSSTSSEDTSDIDSDENEINRSPYKPNGKGKKSKPEWVIDEAELDMTMSEIDTSDSERRYEEVNYTIPRMQDDDLQNPHQQTKRYQKERPEHDLQENPSAARPKMPSLPPKPKRDALKPHSSYPLHMPDEATVHREIEQLRSMGKSYEQEHKVEHEVAKAPAEPEADDITLPEDDLAAQDEAQAEAQTKYDMSKFSDADLNALKDIRSRAEPVQKRREIRERIDKEDTKQLATSLDYAGQLIQDRLRHNLDVYHDLKKLQEKPHGDFTSQDLKFVKTAVCPDGICFSGGLAMTTLAAISATMLSLSF